MLFGWRDYFEKQDIKDIPNKISKIEKIYWIWIGISTLILIWGVLMMVNSQRMNLMCLGLFLAMVGLVNISVLKLWVHIKWSMYQILWNIKGHDKKDDKVTERGHG